MPPLARVVARGNENGHHLRNSQRLCSFQAANTPDRTPAAAEVSPRVEGVPGGRFGASGGVLCPLLAGIKANTLETFTSLLARSPLHK